GGLRFRVIQFADDLTRIHVVANIDVQLDDLSARAKPKTGFICGRKFSAAAGLQEDIPPERGSRLELLHCGCAGSSGPCIVIISATRDCQNDDSYKDPAIFS